MTKPGIQSETSNIPAAMKTGTSAFTFLVVLQRGGTVAKAEKCWCLLYEGKKKKNNEKCMTV